MGDERQPLSLKSWAVETHAEPAHNAVWRQRDIELLNVDLAEYVEALDQQSANCKDRIQCREHVGRCCWLPRSGTESSVSPALLCLAATRKKSDRTDRKLRRAFTPARSVNGAWSVAAMSIVPSVTATPYLLRAASGET